MSWKHLTQTFLRENTRTPLPIACFFSTSYFTTYALVVVETVSLLKSIKVDDRLANTSCFIIFLSVIFTATFSLFKRESTNTHVNVCSDVQIFMSMKIKGLTYQQNTTDIPHVSMEMNSNSGSLFIHPVYMPCET